MWKELATRYLLQSRSMENSIDTMHGPVNRPAIAYVTNVIPNPVISKFSAQSVLFFFVPTDNPDLICTPCKKIL
ncbi:hypothetical protein GCM10011358_12570 [Sinisalibacter lacisalsi]|uniref:Uncharacterized protein n=1 Tax=Sinisalibacter lacisalsi TaxID=1526570 RepID=A0ABQ1QKY4_9RHOB|nr:hypothetical protein GCM10011358_12570 [Sinisalibacter lacisalsi]